MYKLNPPPSSSESVKEKKTATNDLIIQSRHYRNHPQGKPSCVTGAETKPTLMGLISYWLQGWRVWERMCCGTAELRRRDGNDSTTIQDGPRCRVEIFSRESEPDSWAAHAICRSGSRGRRRAAEIYPEPGNLITDFCDGQSGDERVQK